MALPLNGLISSSMINSELGRAANAPFSLTGLEERALAGKLSGAISFSDFYGKSSEIVVTISATRSIEQLRDLFSAADWAAETTKRVVLPVGVNVLPGAYGHAIAVNNRADGQAGSFGGRLIFENRSIFSGLAGSANGGRGGTAVRAMLGRNGNKFEIVNYGAIHGGGGGGGRGGLGGDGSLNVETREPITGESFSSKSPRYYWYPSGNNQNPIYWGDAIVAYVPVGNPPVVRVDAGNGYTYFRGDYGGSGFYKVYRIKTTTTNTNGGAGGDGGKGQDMTSLATNGSAGVEGALNAGRGGAGGAGGNLGLSGSPGSAGETGNRTSGAGGQTGGLAGYAIEGMASVILTNHGTINGQTI